MTNTTFKIRVTDRERVQRELDRAQRGCRAHMYDAEQVADEAAFFERKLRAAGFRSAKSRVGARAYGYASLGSRKWKRVVTEVTYERFPTGWFMVGAHREARWNQPTEVLYAPGDYRRIK